MEKWYEVMTLGGCRMKVMEKPQSMSQVMTEMWAMKEKKDIGKS